MMNATRQAARLFISGNIDPRGSNAYRTGLQIRFIGIAVKPRSSGAKTPDCQQRPAFCQAFQLDLSGVGNSRRIIPPAGGHFQRSYSFFDTSRPHSFIETAKPKRENSYIQLLCEEKAEMDFSAV
jgi:hypothetical protein